MRENIFKQVRVWPNASFLFLFSLSAEEYRVFLEQREEKLKADAAAAAAAAAEALSSKKK